MIRKLRVWNKRGRGCEDEKERCFPSVKHLIGVGRKTKTTKKLEITGPYIRLYSVVYQSGKFSRPDVK